MEKFAPEVTGHMDAIELLTKEHRDVEDLFDALDVTDLPDRRRALLEELAHKLVVHGMIEEQHFYPALRSRAAHLVEGFFDDHVEVRQCLGRLLATPADEDVFVERLENLRRMVESHVNQEERDLFPEARKALGDRTLRSLSDQMGATRDASSEVEPRELIDPETDSTASP